ncbi:MAG: tRNA (guanosine(46)-N7)-methyltransferase TrmB [Planctomycetota bacterium]
MSDSSERATAINLFEDPRSWESLVGTNETVEFEIGSGKGLFLQNASQASPDTFYVGVELAGKFAHRAAQRLAKHELENAVMLHGDAKRFLSEVIPDTSVQRVHCFFPDPWWRNKHKKRRVLNEQSLSDVVRVLKNGGEFHFWTDVLDYYEHICTEVMQSTVLLGPQYVPERSASHSMDYKTHFERRARTDGQPVYRAIFVKP